ncbi:alpha/beta hydrolase [Litoreibacter halocynthiae]|uniref:alpha/beta hydrolase n=1 Tax=Litoreibacter halocynthiae TaxID=1242689 RepID=UPI002490F22A|nr:alpha/beta hydrolase [Litoreibacter halocynthiae]
MPTVVFCHGMPGSVRDANLLQNANPEVNVIALDLLGVGPEEVNLIKSIRELSDNQKVHLVGFSIGAMIAIKIAASYPELVSRLTLVSPAAPLSTGNFLPDMAGKTVFDLAMKRPKMLRAITWVQGVAAKLAPNILINALFAKCGPLERQLLEDPGFKEDMARALSNSFAKEPDTYLTYLSSYVNDWSDALPSVQCPVDLWHGSKDTWSPSEMSQRLKELLGSNAVLHEIPDAEHYSTLTYSMLEPRQS